MEILHFFIMGFRCYSKNMSERKNLSTDLRKYARQTNTRLVVGGTLIIFIIGIALIYAFYGPTGAISGVLCFVGGLSPLALILVGFWLLEFFLKWYRGREDGGQPAENEE